MGNLVLLIPFLTALAAVLAKDRMHSIIIIFSYLTFEGMFKLLSGYHPIVHIGVDIAFWGLLSVWIAIAIVSRNTRLPRVPFMKLLTVHVAWIALLVFSPYTFRRHFRTNRDYQRRVNGMSIRKGYPTTRQQKSGP